MQENPTENYKQKLQEPELTGSNELTQEHQNNTVVSHGVDETIQKQRWYKNKKIISLLAVSLVIFVSAIVMLIKFNNQPAQEQVYISKPQQLAAAITLVEGPTQFSINGESWSDASGGETIEEGYFVRTLNDGRAVVLLDDGSAIRLDNNSQIQISTSESNLVEIMLLSGQVYSRVAEGQGRTFAVVTQRERFEALGTSYKIFSDEQADNLEVYHSKVKVESADMEVAEGNAYDTSTGQSVSINIASLGEDDFLQWNKAKDSSNVDYKDKLGVLGIDLSSKLDEFTEEVGIANSTAATISLTAKPIDKGVQLQWVASNIALGDGYKIVRSTTDNMPDYKKDTAVFVGNTADNNYLLPLDDGKKYFIRVCVYRVQTTECDSYSNTVQVTAPYAPAQAVVGGDVYASVNGTTLKWTFDGTAPHGFKIVMSGSGSTPTYPANSIGFVNPGKLSYELPTNKPAGVYNVRVCKYTASSDVNNGCSDYSSTVTYTISE